MNGGTAAPPRNALLLKIMICNSSEGQKITSVKLLRITQPWINRMQMEGSSVPQEQSSAEQLKAEGVVGFYGQKSPSDKGTSAYLHRMISLFFAPLFLLNRYGISNSTS